MSLNAREKLELVKRAGQIKGQLRDGVKAIERIKLMKELAEIWKKLGKGNNASKGEGELPELVRKLRDGELVSATASVMLDAFKQADGLIPLEIGIKRAEEWITANAANQA